MTNESIEGALISCGNIASTIKERGARYLNDQPSEDTIVVSRTDLWYLIVSMAKFEKYIYYIKEKLPTSTELTDEEPLYSVEQVSKMFSVCPETVRRWLRNGEMRYRQRVSRKDGFLIAFSDIVEFVNNTPRYRKKFQQGSLSLHS